MIPPLVRFLERAFFPGRAAQRRRMEPLLEQAAHDWGLRLWDGPGDRYDSVDDAVERAGLLWPRSRVPPDKPKR